MAKCINFPFCIYSFPIFYSSLRSDVERIRKQMRRMLQRIPRSRVATGHLVMECWKFLSILLPLLCRVIFVNCLKSFFRFISFLKLFTIYYPVSCKVAARLSNNVFLCCCCFCLELCLWVQKSFATFVGGSMLKQLF